MMNSIGTRVQKLRKEKGYSLAKLAELSGSSKTFVWGLEKCNHPRISGEKLMKLSHVLGVTPDILLGIEEHAHEAEDKLFISKYLKSDVDIKHKIRKILDIFSVNG
jgi:transcriptional regulator with XRE-family HTH domain